MARRIGAARWALAVALVGLVLSGCGSKSGYRKVNGRWAWVGWNMGVGRYEIPLKADNDSFVILADPKYAKDRSHVFYEARVIEDADPGSFVLLPTVVGQAGQLYAKDRYRVYLKGYSIIGADPASFALIDPPYARDSVRVYCGTVPMEGSDPASFQILRNTGGWCEDYIKEYFVAQNGDSFANLEVSDSRPAITSNGYWAKDAKHHYRDAAIVEGADYATYHAIDNSFGADKDHEYLHAFRTEVFRQRMTLAEEALKAKRNAAQKAGAEKP